MAKVGSNLCLIEVVKEGAIGISPNVAEPVNTSSNPDTNSLPTIESEQESGSSKEFTSASRRKHPMDPTFTPDAKSNSPIFATPSVRHIARQRGVDLAQLAPGSGKEGRIERRDIDDYLAGAATTKAPVALQDDQDVVVELGRTRHSMWKAMEKVHISINHVDFETDQRSRVYIYPTLGEFFDTSTRSGLNTQW